MEPAGGISKPGPQDHFDEDVHCGTTFMLTIVRPQFTYAPAVKQQKGGGNKKAANGRPRALRASKLKLKSDFLFTNKPTAAHILDWDT